MSDVIRRFFDEILKEITHRPDLRSRLESILASGMRDGTPSLTRKPRGGRRARGIIDPFTLIAAGEQILRERLSALSVEQLKDIVSEHALDSARLALKWKTPDRLIDLIVTTVRSRLAKGDPFRGERGPIKVFYTDVALPPGVTQPDLARLIPFVFNAREVAIEKAFELIKRGAIVWRLEGPNGFVMSKDDIESAYEAKMGRRPRHAAP